MVALGVWLSDDDGVSVVARPTTAAQSAAASQSAAAAAAAASAAAASSAAAAASASASAARQSALSVLPAQLTAALGGAGDTWSVAAVDLATNETMSMGAKGGMYTGSIIKVTVLENLLRVEGGVANLSGYQRDLAFSMITQSSNEAAASLWSQGGRDTALQQTFDLLGLSESRLETGGYFGVTTTSADDQIKVLRQLVTPTFLTAADVTYIRGLMRQVVPDQRWGTPTAADPGTATENKNGWLNNDADDGKWLVNSLGIVTIGGDPYLLATLSQHHPDFDTGVQRLNAAEAAVRAAFTA